MLKASFLISAAMVVGELFCPDCEARVAPSSPDDLYLRLKKKKGKPDNLTVLTVSSLLAETIMNVFADESVSAIFGGENQLF